LNEKIRHQSHEVKKTDEQVSAEREKLLHAARDKKVVELLREKYLANYKKLRNSEENKTQDEVAIRTSQKKG
jgi:flagellar export protein FliJ